MKLYSALMAFFAKNSFYRICGAFLCALVFLTGCTSVRHSVSVVEPAEKEADCRRIVSLSPSITETLYALGLGSSIVGVTRFCTYPKEAVKKASVGGYLDPSKEALLRLKPTIVMLRTEQRDLKRSLEQLKIQTHSVNHQTVEGILNSFQSIGETCHLNREADRLLKKTQQDIQTVAYHDGVEGMPKRKRPSVLLVLDRDFSVNELKQVFVAGQDGFYDWLIQHAGGEPVLSERKGFFPVSVEGLYALNPDVIIELLPSLPKAFSGRPMVSPWKKLTRLKAVQTNRVYTFRDDYMVIPGPRFVQILEQFAHVIHPEKAVLPLSKARSHD